ncbi:MULTISPECIES: mannose-1-phosphate guanylyltransferase/mannose-6-phosphate isomerase [Legionella]|uniref:mannose-1-phosphate guanylyltransferase n=1 Tax=Legionella maceachernii TaxID=466 RepID=A0A0W0VVS0_9GAMM|nr:mannose-1-phosphate guanylyltransferase/mannose-6-phosphate isomerase [Legionella maceachernii]KTD24133.1 mannose-1-phosphate guanylyltransferase [Legionella maceachernii]SJZ86947.1 mannose-1-phosphate guanylyltransferase [Legionella maceachernii]SUO98995.1 Alginate biosynthesis protein AlgA [Legionella maceachernii]
MYLIPTILCGGEGTRLWPVSRELHPKPFIRLEDGHSLLQKTFLRCAQLPGIEEILTVTNRELFFKIEDEYHEINCTDISTSFILEPFKRNTAAAITAASLQTARNHGAEALMLVLGADHLISDQDDFQQAISDALIPATEGKLVVLGIKPEDVNTHHEYIEIEADKVLRFIKNPTLEQASAYLSAKHFLWNSGIYLFKAGTFLQFMEKYWPNIVSAVNASMDQSQQVEGKDFTRLELEPHSFSAVPEKSIEDIMTENLAQVSVIPCNLRWRAIGSWSSFSELVAADAQGNCIEAEALLHEVTNCYIQSDSRLVGAVGVKDLVIIDTPDALLVANKYYTQDIEHIYTQLKIQGHDAHKLHRTVHRPWGSYTILEEGASFKIKRIKVKPGASLSLQMHHHRSEHWIVVSGMAKVVNGEEAFFVNTNESTYIPAGNKHRLENPGVIDLIIIEVQSGEYLGEDDIIRFQDKYGRV